MSQQCVVCGYFDGTGHASYCQYAPRTVSGTGSITTGTIPSELREADDAAVKEQIVKANSYYCAGCHKHVEPKHVTFEERHDERYGGCNGACLPMGMNQHSPFCMCEECIRLMSSQAAAEELINQNIRVALAVERAAITIAAAVLAGADGNASNENMLPKYPMLARNLWNEACK